MVYMYSVAVSLTPYLCRILLWNFFSPLQTFSVSLDAYFFHAVQQCRVRELIDGWLYSLAAGLALNCKSLSFKT